ncbi:Pycsar system effector family protein [Streptomyces naphthomycinicus]|uniref:Pycsar system effector family protein n=1 Tax=Streptomyces naphthomycinicus TaxID=2872625 RepID=UPI001CEC0AC7|nr:Pycsar system effector family protein [Streptomyces sp. TML10]
MRGPLWAGILLILTAAVLAILVVTPCLRAKKKLEAEFSENFIFFGHLQFWEPTALAQKLQEQDLLPVAAGAVAHPRMSVPRAVYSEGASPACRTAFFTACSSS